MRGKAPRGKTKPREAEPLRGRSPRGGQAREGEPTGLRARLPGKERGAGTWEPPDPSDQGRGKGNNPRRLEERRQGQKPPRMLPELSEVWRLLGWSEGKPLGDFHWIKVHNGCSETQLNTPIDGRMAKQQPTSGEPEKLKAQVYFQEPNDE